MVVAASRHRAPMGGRPCAVRPLGSGAASTISKPASVGFGAATRCVDQVRGSPNAADGPGRSAMRRARSVMIAATRSPNTSATPVPGGACTANTLAVRAARRPR